MIDAHAARCWASTASRTSPTARATWRSTTSTPGDTGFKAFRTASGTVGAAICWDQWYPEAARAMALQGAEVLLYPTAIGSEPEEAGAIDTSALWRRAMIGHAVANSCYLAAANRVGTERDRRAASRPSTAELHRRLPGRDPRPKRAAPRRPCSSRRSISAPRRLPRGHGILPGPAARSLRAAADVRRPHAPILTGRRMPPSGAVLARWSAAARVARLTKLYRPV